MKEAEAVAVALHMEKIVVAAAVAEGVKGQVMRPCCPRISTS